MLLGNTQISYPHNILQKLWKWHTYFTEKKTFFFFSWLKFTSVGAELM